MVARGATITPVAWAALAALRDPLSSPSHATGEGLSRMRARGLVVIIRTAAGRVDPNPAWALPSGDPGLSET
jgi:hypothetical protein